MTHLETGAVVVLVIAICEAVKRAGLNTRYVPILSIVLGIAGSLLFGGVSWAVTLVGVVAGLTSSGLYSGFKKTVLNK